MQSTFTLEDWIFILRAWLDESYPLDQGKSQMKKHNLNPEGNQATAPGAEATGLLSRRAFVLRGSAAATLGAALSGLPLALGDDLSRESGFTAFSEKQKK